MTKLLLPLLAVLLLANVGEAGCRPLARVRGAISARHGILYRITHRHAQATPTAVPAAYAVQGYKAMPAGPACPECAAVPRVLPK